MEESSDIEVTVKTLDSQSRSYTVGSQLTVKDFKEHIAPSVGIPVDKQRLIYQGRVLQDERTLTEYNVGDKVIHLVERAPPPPSQPGSGGSSGSSEAGVSSPNSTTSQGSSQVPPHDRNANSYVMLGTFNLPVNLMDPQQIQMSVQQMIPGLGENARNARVTTSTGNNGSMNVHIDMDQSVQSEPRLRLLLAENLLRDTNALIQRMEGQASDNSSPPASAADSAAAPPPSSSTSTPSPSTQPMDTSPLPSDPPPSSSSTQTEGPLPPTGPNHPSPGELVEILSELRRVEERLQPFIQRAHSILESATTTEYANAEREEDQRILNLVGESLRLLGNALVALSDLRCNLLSPTPRHLHVVRSMSHYTSPVILPGAVNHQHIPLHMNLGATVTMAANGRPASEGQAPPTGQSEQAGQGQTFPSQPPLYNQQAGQGQAGPRVIRISHQAVPVVMMQMNADDSGSNPQAAGLQNPAGMGQAGALPPDFMRSIMQQMGQYAAAMATAGAVPTGQPTPSGSGSTATSSATPSGPNTPTTTPTAPPPPPPNAAQARVVFTRPAFGPGMMAAPAFSARGPTANVSANLRAPMPGQQPGQPFPPAALNQMISGMVGQLLMPNQTAGQTATSSSSHTFSSSSFPPTGPIPNTTPSPGTATAPGQPDSTPTQPQGVPPDLGQLLSSLLSGVGGSAEAMGPGGAPSITVTMPGVPAFIQGVSEFMQQASQPGFQGSSPTFSGTPTAPTAGDTSQGPTPPPGSGTSGLAGENLNPELFTGIVQGVLSTMMGSLGQAQSGTESIAQFMQRLSHTTNIFISPDEPNGFFGELLTLVCQTFSMSDLVLLLHGQHQPLSRIRPQLSQFFTQNYLNGREPTDQNITAAAEDLVNELEETITESFSSVAVLEGVDVTQTNMSFFRQQLSRIATHILRCTDQSFGPHLLQMCNQGLFECLALNLYCLRGEQTALTTVINHRIRRMSADMSPSLVNWMTSMMTMRLQVILEHMPVTEEQIRHYVVQTPREEPTACGTHEPEQDKNIKMEETLSPVPATTAEEAMSSSWDTRAAAREGGPTEGSVPPRSAMAAEAVDEEPVRDPEAWAVTVPPEWVPIIRHDLITQRKIKTQPPMSDAYLHGMPAKRRKTGQGDGALLSLSDAVSRAAKTAGVKPVTPSDSLQEELESEELQEAYAEQVKADIKKRVREDPDFTHQQFPNTHRAFSSDS